VELAWERVWSQASSSQMNTAANSQKKREKRSSQGVKNAAKSDDAVVKKGVFKGVIVTE